MSDTDKTSSPEAAIEQQTAGGWPRPGEEGFVHPDGTPQAAQQLADNRRAAADRAAAGSTVHGAPLGTPGPNPEAEARRAGQAAADHSGTTAAEARKAHTEFVRDKTDEVAAEAGTAESTPAGSADQETTADSKPKTRR